MTKKKFVLLHEYCDTGFISIVGFSDSHDDLNIAAQSLPHYGSYRHNFAILENESFSVYLSNFKSLSEIKDDCLLKLCENVAQYLAIGEYAMLKKSYFKAQSWFERAKDSAKIASVIIDNY